MKTKVEIRGEDFWIDGRPTYAGRSWEGRRIEGLLFNARMVQAIFDDLNPETRNRWAYPDTGRWDPERNTREFCEALPSYRRAGLLAVTANFQGGSPEGCHGTTSSPRSIATRRGATLTLALVSAVAQPVATTSTATSCRP